MTKERDETDGGWPDLGPFIPPQETRAERDKRRIDYLELKVLELERKLADAMFGGAGGTRYPPPLVGLPHAGVHVSDLRPDRAHEVAGAAASLLYWCLRHMDEGELADALAVLLADTLPVIAVDEDDEPPDPQEMAREQARLEAELDEEAFEQYLSGLAVRYEGDPDGAFEELMGHRRQFSAMEALKIMRSFRGGQLEFDWAQVDPIRVMEYLMESDVYRLASHARLALQNAFGKQYARRIACKGKRYWLASDFDFYK